MPSVFLIDHGGPIDPNIYRAYENGRPDITNSGLDQTTEVFLDAIWRQYGGADADALNDIGAPAPKKPTCSRASCTACCCSPRVISPPPTKAAG